MTVSAPVYRAAAEAPGAGPSRTVRARRARALLLPLLAAVSGCALQRHEPARETPAQAQAGVLAASPNAPQVRELLARQGIDTRHWPLAAWDAAALRALALALHPQLRVARVEREGALARRDAERAAARPGVWSGGELTLERHTGGGGAASPWTVGVVLELGLSERLLGVSRGAARADAADAMADEVLADAALAAWQVHRRVRDARLAWMVGAQRVDLAEALWRARREEADAWRSRLAHGAADARETDRARQLELEAAQEAEAARAAERGLRATLAAAVGLGVTQVAPMVLTRDDLLTPSPPLTDAGSPRWQEAALLDRLDVRAGVARYAAADATLRLELARQLPELVLKPGWAWDQGDRRWSLGVGVSLPAVGGNRAGIQQASARRDAEAARMAVLQSQALAELEAARAAADAARGDLLQSQAQVAAASGTLQRTQRRLAAGSADRLETIEARRGVLEAQRKVLAARSAEAAARAALEDVLQRPLEALDGPRPDLLAGAAP